MYPDRTIWILLLSGRKENQLLVENCLPGPKLKRALLRASRLEEACDLLGTHSFDLVIAGGFNEEKCLELAAMLSPQQPPTPCLYIVDEKYEALEESAVSGRNDFLLLSEFSAERLERSIYQLVLPDVARIAGLIAHEIKNPLTSIHLSVKELRELLQGEQDTEEFLMIIERNERRIHRLLEDLLNATRFDTLRMKKLLLPELINEALALVADRIRLKGIRLEKQVAGELPLAGDREKLVMAMLNILVNAVEAAPEKEGCLQVNAFPSGGSNCLMVTDNGKGIPEGDLIRLFEPFFSSKKNGTGLGLAAAYSIITRHGGSIRVTSKAGEGSTFIITLPGL